MGWPIDDGPLLQLAAGYQRRQRQQHKRATKRAAFVEAAKSVTDSHDEQENIRRLLYKSKGKSLQSYLPVRGGPPPLPPDPWRRGERIEETTGRHFLREGSDIPPALRPPNPPNLLDEIHLAELLKAAKTPRHANKRRVRK
jgi:hypothetical protein